MDEIRTDEEIAEELEEEIQYKGTLKAIEAHAQRYKSLFGDLPSDELTPSAIQNKIAEEMNRRNLRPYRL